MRLRKIVTVKIFCEHSNSGKEEERGIRVPEPAQNVLAAHSVYGVHPRIQKLHQNDATRPGAELWFDQVSSKEACGRTWSCTKYWKKSIGASSQSEENFTQMN